MKCLRYIFIFCAVSACSFAQETVDRDTLAGNEPFFDNMRLGICAKKFMGFYWVNGVTLVTNETTFGAPVMLGVNLTSSLLGSAMVSDALSLHMFEMFGFYMFRDKKPLQPFAGLNFGGAFADYDDPAFSRLQQGQTVLAPEFGINYGFKYPINISASFGYHLITGNGKRGLGLMYPLFGQLSITYRQ